MRADGLPYAEAAAQATAIAEGAEAPVDATPINLVPEEYRGLDRFEARKLVIDAITAEGLAVMEPRTVTDEDGNETTEQVPFVEAKKIMQPFGDRSKVVIEPMLTDQWFVDTDQIVQPAIDAVRSGEVTILPEQDKKVYFHWLENIEPWCISRQLWWGHQIPVWYGPSKEDLEKAIREIGNDYTGLSRLAANIRSPKMFCAASAEQAVKAAQEYYGELALMVSKRK